MTLRGDGNLGLSGRTEFAFALILFTRMHNKYTMTVIALTIEVEFNVPTRIRYNKIYDNNKNIFNMK